MRMHGGKEQRVGDQPEKASEITLQDAVEKKTKEKFLGRRCNGDGENDDHDPLLDRARAIEKLDDALFTRTASENALRNRVSKGDQRISREQEHRSHAQGTKKTGFGETAQIAQIKPAQSQKSGNDQNDAESEKKVLDKNRVVELGWWIGKGGENA